MATSRRRLNGVTQTQFHQPHPAEVAQPVHSNFLPLSSYEQSWSSPGNFVHPDPAVDNSHDTIMAPPPATLTLSVPANSSYNSLLYSPGSDHYSHSQDSFMPPSYGSSIMEGNDWSSTKLDPALYSAGLTPSPKLQSEKLENNSEPEVKIKDMSPSSLHVSTSSMSPKQRAAHRKAIEEKSSMKRKLAEQRLSKAVTSRLGGTFVPGLANQMNQAADIIEKDARTIQALEAEIHRLRKSCNPDVQMKYRS